MLPFVNNFPCSDELTSRSVIEEFNSKHATIFTFGELEKQHKLTLWTNLFKFLKQTRDSQCIVSCLTSIRILSRDAALLTNHNFSNDHLVCLMEFSNTTESNSDSLNVAIEAVKCLCNILKNSTSCQSFFFSKNGIEHSWKRIENESLMYPIELKLFDSRLLFLVTALDISFRNKLYEELHGLDVLVKFFSGIAASNVKGTRKLLSSCNETEIQIMSEVLKVLFNLLNSRTIRTSSSSLELLCSYLKEILLLQTQQGTLVYKLQVDVVNLLTTLPLECCVLLISPIDLTQQDVSTDDPLMAPARTVLNILDSTLTEFEAKKGTSQELISPILMVLLNLSKSHRLYRKYFRKLVLPYLRDVFSRPEEGNTLRNKMCRLLTSPVTSVGDLAASWLFVLCKEKVSRMVKYTGYGNAAGLFARHGFPTVTDGYSSDSDSDTEEYLTNKEEINPVVGCRVVRPPEPAMTDEQKECFAMELLNSIDKLQRGGIIQPCTIGEDGKPRPIEHVLELQSNNKDIIDED